MGCWEGDAGDGEGRGQDDDVCRVVITITAMAIKTVVRCWACITNHIGAVVDLAPHAF